jgi:hypothetical protein
MKELLMSVSFIVLAAGIVPADAASTLAIGGGVNRGNVTTLTGAATLGNAAAASVANGFNTSIGSGVAVATPAGSLSAGIGTSIGQSTGQSGAVAGPGGGAALSGAFSNNSGLGVGGGFTNVLP